MYLSFKYGNSERVDGDRFFCDLNERCIDKLLNEVSKIALVNTWQSSDKRYDYSTIWLNAIMIKQIE